jgi:phenylalanyl-tRNA synthetase beta chain
LQWGVREHAVDFFDAKGDLEALFAPQQPRFVAASHPALHPGRSARVELNGQAVGWVGELHPKWRQAYELPQAPVLFEIELDALTARELPVFKPISRQQPAWRDIAVVLDERIDHDTLLAAIRDDRSGLVRSARLFDIYKPATASAEFAAGERSLAVRLELRDDDATLTDERIEAAVSEIVARLKSTLGARLRG